MSADADEANRSRPPPWARDVARAARLADDAVGVAYLPEAVERAYAARAALRDMRWGAVTSLPRAADGPPSRAAARRAPPPVPAANLVPSHTARDVSHAVRTGAVAPDTFVREALRGALADPCSAFLHVDPDAIERQLSAMNRHGALAGVPVAVKDNFADAGQPLTCASRALEGHYAAYTSTAVARLRAAGAVVIGRTNMDAFAMGSATEFSDYAPTRNPRDPTRSPGGSSGGSAAAVAAGIVPIALGSDTGGSVRQPAAFCGVVGVKPTYGRISRAGLVAMASSLDAVSPFGGDVRDAALALTVLAGHDPADATSLDSPVPDLVAACDRGVRGLRVGVLTGLGAVEPGVAAALDGAAERLQRAGAALFAVDIPSLRAGLAIYTLIAAAEASSNLARIDGLRYGRPGPADAADPVVTARTAGLGAEVQRRVLLGTWLLAHEGGAFVAEARAAAARLRADLLAALGSVDALLCPTSATVAFRAGARAADPAAMALSDLFTVPASVAGLPALSVPCGLSEGLPVGAHLVGRPLDEATLFAAAAVLEAATL